MATISESLFLNGSYPVRVDQSINTSSQIATAIYTYSDGSKVYGAYAYADNAAVDYLAAAYGLSAVATPTPVSGNVATLTGFAVATNGLSITHNTPGVTLTAVNGTYGINGVFNPLVLSTTGSFTTAQIATGDVVKITIFSSTPATTAISAVAVTNNSTYVASTTTTTLPTRPLVFTKFNLGASAVDNKPTVLYQDFSMAISSAQNVADFNELRFIKPVIAYPGLYTIAIEANSNFTRNIARAQPTGDTLLDIETSYDATLVYGLTSNVTGTALLSNSKLPASVIMSIKKSANGQDLIVSTSTDGTTFTPLCTRAGAFVGLSQFFIKLIKIETTNAPATALTVEMSLR